MATRTPTRKTTSCAGNVGPQNAQKELTKNTGHTDVKAAMSTANWDTHDRQMAGGKLREPCTTASKKKKARQGKCVPSSESLFEMWLSCTSCCMYVNSLLLHSPSPWQNRKSQDPEQSLDQKQTRCPLVTSFSTERGKKSVK